jgi:hypothetical protein
VKFKSLASVRTTWYSVRTLISQATSVQMMRSFHPNSHMCLEVSNYSRLHPFGLSATCLNAFQCSTSKMIFFPKHRHGKTVVTVRRTWLFCPDTILDKARSAKDLQPSGHQSSLSRCLVLIMEIACSRSATVRTLGQHHSDAALFRKEI